MQGQFEVSAIDLSILIGYLILSRVLALWLTRGGAKDTMRRCEGDWRRW